MTIDRRCNAANATLSLAAYRQLVSDCGIVAGCSGGATVATAKINSTLDATQSVSQQDQGVEKTFFAAQG
jgi:cysteine synthase